MLVGSEKMVLRMPKEKMCRKRFMNLTAASWLVGQRLPSYTPKLILWDETQNNLLGRQYWLETCVPGESLHLQRIWSKVDRRALAFRLADFLADMFDVTFPNCGPLVARSPTSAEVGNVQFMPADYPNVDDIGVGTLWRAVRDNNPPTDINSWFRSRFKAIESCRHDKKGVFFMKFARLLLSRRVAKSDQRNCLVHPDFYERNIVYHLSTQHASVVDWDDCEVLPSELAYFVPGWLWESVDSDDPKRRVYGYDPDKELKDEESKDVRDIFFERINSRIPGYVDVVRETRATGLIALGGLARYGTSYLEPGYRYYQETFCLFKDSKLWGRFCDAV